MITWVKILLRGVIAFVVGYLGFWLASIVGLIIYLFLVNKLGCIAPQPPPDQFETLVPRCVPWTDEILMLLSAAVAVSVGMFVFIKSRNFIK